MGRGGRGAGAPSAPRGRLPRDLAGRVQTRSARRRLQAHGDQPAPLAVARARRGVRRRPTADRVSGLPRSAAGGGEDERRREAVGDQPDERQPGRRFSGSRTSMRCSRSTIPCQRWPRSARLVRAVAALIPAAVERRARWVLDTIGARDLGFGDDVAYEEAAWEQVERRRAARRRRARRGVLPSGTGRGTGFSSPGSARAVPRVLVVPRSARPACRAASAAARDRAAALGWRALRHRLTHDVDVPWRWTRLGVHGAAARLKGHVRCRPAGRGRAGGAGARCRAVAQASRHRSRTGASTGFFASRPPAASHRRSSSWQATITRPTAPVPAAYERLRPRLVETLARRRRRRSACTGATRQRKTSSGSPRRRGASRRSRDRSQASATTICASIQRRTSRRSTSLGFRYDSSLGFSDRPGFRAGIAHPFRPWDDADGWPARRSSRSRWPSWT